MKGMRLAGAKTMEPANGYMEKEYLPWWNRTRVGTWIGQEPKLRCRAWHRSQAEDPVSYFSLLSRRKYSATAAT